MIQFKDFWKRYLPILIILGMLLGVAWSVFASIFGFSNFTINWIKPFGDIFINLLKLIAVPLVLFSVIKGVSSISNIVTLGRMGVKTLFAYLCTTIISVSIGLFLVNNIKPGESISTVERVVYASDYVMWLYENGVLDRAERMSMKLDSLKSQYISEDDGYSVLADDRGIHGRFLKNDDFVASKVKIANEQKNQGPLQFIVDMIPSNIFVSLTDNKLMLQIIFFAIFFGVTLVLLC